MSIPYNPYLHPGTGLYTETKNGQTEIRVDEHRLFPKIMEWFLRELTPLSPDAPKEVVADWLEENHRQLEANWLRKYGR